MMSEDAHNIYEGCPNCAKDSAGNHENGCPYQKVGSSVPTAQFGYPIMGQVGWICPNCNRSVNPNNPTCIYCAADSVKVSDSALPAFDSNDPVPYPRWGNLHELRGLLPDIAIHMTWMIASLDFQREQTGLNMVDSTEMAGARETVAKIIDEVASWNK